MGKKAKEIFTTVTSHHPSISGLPHDLPPSVARQQRKIPDPWPPQAAGALKIALLGAHAEHGPRGALQELDHSTLLLRLLSVLCSALPTCKPYPGHVDALSNASTALTLTNPQTEERTAPRRLDEVEQDLQRELGRGTDLEAVPVLSPTP